MQVLDVPNKIEARTFEGLRRKMLLVNSRLHGKVIYQVHPPSYKGAKWYAIFNEKMSEKELLREALDVKAT